MGTLTAALASTAFTAGSVSVTYGGLLTAAALGAGAYTMTQQPDAPKQIAPTAPVSDKTTLQQADQLDPASIGDESEKRKRKSAKDKFKIKKDTEISTPEVGVNVDNTQGTVPGVQI